MQPLKRKGGPGENRPRLKRKGLPFARQALKKQFILTFDCGGIVGVTAAKTTIYSGGSGGKPLQIGGGDGTCTRVPTLDRLTFSVLSLSLSSNGRKTNRPTVARRKICFEF